jgi:hypothetical protein
MSDRNRMDFSKTRGAPGDNYGKDSGQGRNDEDEDEDGQRHPLDSEKATRTFQRLQGWYTHELDRQSENRAEMQVDDDFYDHNHWSDAEKAVLAERGQAAMVFNLTQTTVNWVLGTQRRASMDYKILPRRSEGAGSAKRKTELMKHLSDENRSEFEVSAAFAMAVKVGLGWLECGAGREEEGTQVYDRHEDWRSMLWDSTSKRYDLLDARYIFRTKWLDLDIAANLWGGRQGVLSLASANGSKGLYGLDGMGDEPMDSVETEHFAGKSGLSRSNRMGGYNRDRIRVVECWFKMPVPDAQIIRGGQFNGELFDDWSTGHWNDLNSGLATLIARPKEVIHVALMTDGGLLDLRRSPYRHNRFPFTPIWGYRRARDGMPYGLIRGIRDINRDLNKRASKALHHLSTTRVTVQQGAVEDLEALRDEAGRPDAVIEYLQGQPAPMIHTDTNIAAAHIDLMGRDADMIQQVGGVTDENMGRKTNATSGIAIERRQDQGALATSSFFENLRQSRQIHGEKLVVMAETYYDKQEQFRIVDARGNPDFKTINDGDPENAIADNKADFIISEQDWRATARQAEYASMVEMVKSVAPVAPQLIVGIIDLIIESSDVANKDEIVKRVRAVTGAADPDEDPKNPSPETEARNASEAKKAEMAERQASAVIAELEAKARKITAEATKAEQGVTTDLIAQLTAALAAAIAVAGAPMAAAAADQILIEAARAAETANRAGQPPGPQAPQPQPQMQQPMPQGAGMPQPAQEQPQPQPQAAI